MNLSKLTISDLSSLMAHLYRRMSKVEERTPENTAIWEVLAFKRNCIGTEFTKRMDAINFPVKGTDTERQRSEWLTNRLSELIPVEDRGKVSDILQDHLTHFNII